MSIFVSYDKSLSVTRGGRTFLLDLPPFADLAKESDDNPSSMLKYWNDIKCVCVCFIWKEMSDHLLMELMNLMATIDMALKSLWTVFEYLCK